MRALLDVNVLIALLDSAHLHHARATVWLREHIRMNAKEQFVAASAHVDAAAVKPLPQFAQDLRHRQPPRHPRADARDQPVRHAAGVGAEKNPADLRLRLLGPYTDPAAKIDIRKGLPALRQRWIEERGDSEAAGLPPPTAAPRGRPELAGCASTSSASRAARRPG
jgi:hypothetical protein